MDLQSLAMDVLLLAAVLFALVFAVRAALVRLLLLLPPVPKWLKLAGRITEALLPIPVLAAGVLGSSVLPGLFGEVALGPKRCLGAIAALAAMVGYKLLKGVVEDLLGWKLPDKLPPPSELLR